MVVPNSLGAGAGFGWDALGDGVWLAFGKVWAGWKQVAGMVVAGLEAGATFSGIGGRTSETSSIGGSSGLSQYGTRFGFGRSGLKTPAFGLPRISRLQS